MTTIAQHIVESRKKFELYSASFRNCFGVSIIEYWHPLLGFDVIKFDDRFLKSRFPTYEDGKTSMKDCIRKEFGEVAVIMIEELI